VPDCLLEVPEKTMKEWLKDNAWLAGPLFAFAWILYQLGVKRLFVVPLVLALALTVAGCLTAFKPFIAHFRKRWYAYLALLVAVVLVIPLINEDVILPRLANMNLIWRESYRKHEPGRDTFTVRFTLVNKTAAPIYLNKVIFYLSPVFESAMNPPFHAAKVSSFNDKITARLSLEGGSAKINTLANQGRKVDLGPDAVGTLIFGRDRIMLNGNEQVDFELRLTVLEPSDDILIHTRDLRVQTSIVATYDDSSLSERSISAFGIQGIGPQSKAETLMGKPNITYR
jgi:hypothetical protein